MQRAAVPGLACVGREGDEPLGVVPPPPAGASLLVPRRLVTTRYDLCTYLMLWVS